MGGEKMQNAKLGDGEEAGVSRKGAKEAKTQRRNTLIRHPERAHQEHCPIRFTDEGSAHFIKNRSFVWVASR